MFSGIISKLYHLYKLYNDILLVLNFFLCVHVFQEVHRLQKEADEANKRSSVLERDNQRSELQLGDMAQQVGSQSLPPI